MSICFAALSLRGKQQIRAFVENAIRLIAVVEALASSDPIVCITGLQVLSILGQDEDLEVLKTALEHKSKHVKKHARAARI